MITVSSHEASGIRSGHSNSVNRLIVESGRGNEGAGLSVSINLSLPRVRQSLSKCRLTAVLFPHPRQRSRANARIDQTPAKNPPLLSYKRIDCAV